MHDHVILATTNTAIDASNENIAERRSQHATLFSSDSLISDESNRDTAFAALEHLNLLNAQGVRPCGLELRSNDLAMLSRNLNFGEGFVDGQKCFFLEFYPILVLSRFISLLLFDLSSLCHELTSTLKLADKVSFLVVLSFLSASHTP